MYALQAVSPGDLEVLLTWFVVLLACTSVLTVEALGLALLSFARPQWPLKGILRATALVAFVAAIGAGVVARAVWATHQDLLAFSMMRSYPPSVRDWYEQTINHTIPFYETVGSVAVVPTGVLLLAGLALFVRAIRGTTTSPDRTAGPCQHGELSSARPV